VLTVILSPDTSGKASSVAITGRGFTPSGTATVKYESIIVVTSIADASGTLDTSFSVPRSAPLGSTQIVEAIDDATGRTVSVEHRVPLPSISIEPPQGFPGTPYSIVGRDFAPSAFVTPVLFDGVDIAPYPYTITDSSGAFEVQSIVPKVPGRDVAVSATAWDGVAGASFKVLPVTVGLNPTTGVPNTTVIINGWNFPGSSELESLSIGGLDVLADAESLNVNLGFTTTVWGVFEVEVTIPEMSSGDAEVVAAVAGVSASTLLTVPPIVIALAPAAGRVFGPVIVRCSGFPAFALVTSVTIGGTQLLGSHLLETDANGAFELRAGVPSFHPGPVLVSVTVGNFSINTDFTVLP
jgi:hypothetical protein